MKILVEEDVVVAYRALRVRERLENGYAGFIAFCDALPGWFVAAFVLAVAAYALVGFFTG